MLQGDIRQFAMRGIFEPSCQAYAIVKVPGLASKRRRFGSRISSVHRSMRRKNAFAELQS